MNIFINSHTHTNTYIHTQTHIYKKIVSIYQIIYCIYIQRTMYSVQCTMYIYTAYNVQCTYIQRTMYSVNIYSVQCTVYIYTVYFHKLYTQLNVIQLCEYHIVLCLIMNSNYAYTCTHIHTHEHIYTNINTRMYIYTFILKHIYKHIHLYSV